MMRRPGDRTQRRRCWAWREPRAAPAARRAAARTRLPRAWIGPGGGEIWGWWGGAWGGIRRGDRGTRGQGEQIISVASFTLSPPRLDTPSHCYLLLTPPCS